MWIFNYDRNLGARLLVVNGIVGWQAGCALIMRIHAIIMRQKLNWKLWRSNNYLVASRGKSCVYIVWGVFAFWFVIYAFFSCLNTWRDERRNRYPTITQKKPTVCGLAVLKSTTHFELNWNNCATFHCAVSHPHVNRPIGTHAHLGASHAEMSAY